jgi:hypothetical protein
MDFSFRVTGVDTAERTMYLVQYDSPDFWRRRLGRNYLQKNYDAIKRKVKIKRIWVQPKEILEAYQNEILEQEELGIEVLVVVKDEIPPPLWGDFGVIDGKMLVRPIPPGDGEIIRERISIIESEVEQAEEKFKQLSHYAIKASDYFRQQEA